MKWHFKSEMLTIRKEQIRIFEQLAQKNFQNGLIPHVREHFPAHAEYLGDLGVLRVIEQGCANAKSYGFETERDLCLYTDLSIMLGVGFDTDPQLPWAAAILLDGSLKSPWDRMDKLWDRAMDYMFHVLGPDNVFPVAAYRLAIRHFPLDRLGSSLANIESAMIGYFEAIWFEKVEYIGNSRLIEFLKKSFADAKSHDVMHFNGQAEFAIFSFLLGHHFFNDPVHPWAQEILEGYQAQGIIPQRGEEKMVHLRRVYEKWLNQVFPNQRR
jgi:hypothetical protein